VIAEDKVKKHETLPVVANEEIPFSIPSGWCVMRMGWLARKLGAGSTPLGGKSVYQDEGIPFLRSQNVHDDGLRLEDVALIPRAVHNKMSGTHIEDQDILLNITGASIGRCALVPSGFGEGNVSQHVAIIRLFVPAIREFIHLSLVSPNYQNLIMDVQVGVSREGLSMQRLRFFPMVLPPLAEQHRIVAKVDELIALCDELEAAQAKRERRRDLLVATTLHGLNNGDANPETGISSTFQESARFYFNHLPRLTTRPEHIQKLRQTILNLAVRGRSARKYR
jgi:type I restriction enzyme S subunit